MFTGRHLEYRYTIRNYLEVVRLGPDHSLTEKGILNCIVTILFLSHSPSGKIGVDWPVGYNLARDVYFFILRRNDKVHCRS